MNYCLKLSYDGTAYHGWQRQNNANSIQEIIENTLTILLDETCSLNGCGRTDTGVHAKCYYANFSTEKSISEKFVYQLNALLPKDIAIAECFQVKDTFHARFSALSRTYQYELHFEKNPFLVNKSCLHFLKPDLNKMNEACKILLSYTDFESFCKKGADNKTTLCHLELAEWEQVDNRFIFTIKADRFLRNMVRAIVGTMLDIGLGRSSLSDFREIIESKNRQKSGRSVPACGLYLTDIQYPNELMF